MPQQVPPDGSLSSRIAIVGARPGPDEARAGQGFVGPSGKLLWDLLGVPRSACYVTNVRKDFSYTDSTPTNRELQEALPELKAELEATSANIIIAIGGDALRALCGKSSIDTWRGSILESTLLPGRKVIGTYHTAATLHTKGHKFSGYNLRYLIKLDLRRAIRESLYPDIRRLQRTFILDPDVDQAIEIVRGLREPISVDIETFGDTMSCFALSDHSQRAVCIPTIGGHLYPSEIAAIWREVDRRLRAARIWGQNLCFDITKLERIGFRLPHIDFDTLLGHAFRWAELGSPVKRKGPMLDDFTGKHALGFLVSIYCDGEPFYKHESEEAWTTPGLELGERFRRYWTYNCKDAACTYQVGEGEIKEIEQWGARRYFDMHVMSLIRPVMAMQARGFRVDLDAKTKVDRRLTLETEYLQLQLNHAVGFSCNVKSKPDLIYLLHEKLRLPKLKMTAGGKKGKPQPSTDEDTLLQLAYNSPYPEIFRLILDIRERRTMREGFLNMELDTDGHYKASYMIHGATNGRLSSRAVRKGPQLQNIPMWARRLFVASKGNALLSADLRRAEAMHVAFDAQELGMIEAFLDQTRDWYKEVAAFVMGIKLEQVTKFLRDLFKRIVHAYNYGLGPRKLVIVLRLAGIDIMQLQVPGGGPESKAKYVLEGYGRMVPNIKMRQDRIRRQLRGEYAPPGAMPEKRHLTSALGRKRVFLGPIYGDSAEETMRIAFSYDPSATVVGVTNKALRTLHEKDEPIVAQTHDSVALDTPLQRLEPCAANVREAFNTPITLHNRTFTIPVEIKVGFNWGDYHEKDNPRGLMDERQWLETYGGGRWGEEQTIAS